MLSVEQQILQRLKESRHVLITCRKDPHVDSLASCLSLFLLLKKLGVAAEVVIDSPNRAVRQTGFLPDHAAIAFGAESLKKLVIRLGKPDAKVGTFRYDVVDHTLNIYITPSEGTFRPDDVKAEYGKPSHDCIVVCDSPDLQSLGRVYTDHASFFLETPVINIDHDADNEHFGRINHVDITAVSTTEVLYRLFEKEHGQHIDEDVATVLLTGMIAKTESFKTPTVTPKSLMTASELVQRGARRDQVIHHLYRQHELPTLRLWGRILARLQHDPSRQLVWSAVKRDDFERSGATEDNLAGIIDELIATTPEAKTIALLFERPDGSIGGWLKTEPHTNALELTKPLQGHGSKTFAEFAVTGISLEEAQAKVQQLIPAK